MRPERLTGAVVKTVTPYRNGQVDYEGFRRYITWAVNEGAESFIIPSDVGDFDKLSFEEKTQLVRTAAEASACKALILATVVPAEQSVSQQVEAYLKAGATGANIRFPGADDETVRNAVCDAAAAGAEFIMLTDFKAGGFDMNRGGAAPGISQDLILELLEEHPQFKAVMISLPLNMTGAKCSLLKKAAGERINIVADTATDQFLEQIDRGAEGFTTGVLVHQFNRIYSLYTSGNVEEARSLFFELLRVIVWTKQYVDREPYFYQLYLKNKGLIEEIGYRTERYIDEYMIRYGDEMYVIAEETEKK